MEYLSITGNKRLNGKLRVPAAKNSVLPMLAASLLCAGDITLLDVPRLSDVEVSFDILQSLGCTATFDGSKVHVNSRNVTGHSIPKNLMGAMRSSVFYLAPLLVRTGFATVHSPGGCRLGARPIDIHLDGLAHMGAQICLCGDELVLSAPQGLAGADYTLRFPSVGATETLLMAACAATGTTVLRNAAAEPEITDLAGFLTACGANIIGAGTDVIFVRGSNGMHGAVYTPFPDRITASTVLCATAALGGCVSLSNCLPQHIDATLQILRRMGCESSFDMDTLTFCSDARLYGCGSLTTGVYPAFCTDSAPLVAAALLTADGASNITDTVFENRFACAEGFAQMGARAVKSGRSIIINGVKQLQGAFLTAPDLRGGAALLIAAMCAQGESRIYGTGHLNRGYEDIALLFASLGASVNLQRDASNSIA